LLHIRHILNPSSNIGEIAGFFKYQAG
jgi:hypothetical protein